MASEGGRQGVHGPQVGSHGSSIVRQNVGEANSARRVEREGEGRRRRQTVALRRRSNGGGGIRRGVGVILMLRHHHRHHRSLFRYFVIVPQHELRIIKCSSEEFLSIWGFWGGF